MIDKMTWKDRFWWWAFSKTLLGLFAHGHRVGNRYVRERMLRTTVATITFRDTTQPDAYTREELYAMLRLLRHHEEIQNWRVPEPIRCAYCFHSTAADGNGHCPICISRADNCERHSQSLTEEWRRAVNRETRPADRDRTLDLPLMLSIRVCTLDRDHEGVCNGEPRFDCVEAACNRALARSKIASGLCGND